MTDEDRDEARASTVCAASLSDWPLLLKATRPGAVGHGSAVATALPLPLPHEVERAEVVHAAVAFVERSHGTSVGEPLLRLLMTLRAAAQDCGWTDNNDAWRSAAVWTTRAVAGLLRVWCVDHTVRSRGAPLGIGPRASIRVDRKHCDAEGLVIAADWDYWDWKGDRRPKPTEAFVPFSSEQAVYALLRIALDCAPDEHRWECDGRQLFGSAGCNCDAQLPDDMKVGTGLPSLLNEVWK